MLLSFCCASSLLLPLRSEPPSQLVRYDRQGERSSLAHWRSHTLRFGAVWAVWRESTGLVFVSLAMSRSEQRGLLVGAGTWRSAVASTVRSSGVFVC